MNYEVKLNGKLFSKKIKNVKGHVIAQENTNLMIIILEDERRIFININKYKMIEFSDGWFKGEKKKANEEVNKGAI